MPALSLTNLKEITNNLVKSITGIKDIEKSSISTLIDACIKNHTTYISTMSKFTAKDNTKLKESIFTYLQNNNSASGAAWSKYVSSLSGIAKVSENKDMFSSLLGTHESIKKVLTEIKNNLNIIFGEEDTFSVINTRRSHIAIFGAIISSMQLYRWSIYVFTYLTSVVDGTDKSIPKYRELYLSNNVDDVAKLVNSFFDNKVSIISEIETMRAKASDSILTTGGVVNYKAFDPITITTILKVTTFLVAAASSLFMVIAILKWLPERIDLFVHELYLQNKETKEWLESHIAKLRMDLEQMDPNDPKYQRIAKAIEVYDDKIRDLDRKIDAYLND